MKRMIAWVLSLVPTLLNAQVADTLHIENPSSVDIISSPGSLSVIVEGTADNPAFHYSNSVKAESQATEVSDRLNFETPFTKKRNLSHWKLTLISSEEAGLVGGIIGGDDLFGNAKKREISADLGLLGIRYYPGLKNHYLSLGWHVGFSSTQVTNSGLRFLLDNGNLAVAGFPAGATDMGKNTEIWRFRFSIPLQYTFVFGNTLAWRASAGAEVHSNLLKYTRSQYTLDGNHVIERIDNIKPNLISADLIASLTYEGMGARFRYSPTPVFNMPKGPSYRTWSVGFLLEF